MAKPVWANCPAGKMQAGRPISEVFPRFQRDGERMVHTETAPGPDDAYQVGRERWVHQALEGCSAMGEQAQIQALVGYVHQPEAEGRGLLSDDAPWWSHDVVKCLLAPRWDGI